MNYINAIIQSLLLSLVKLIMAVVGLFVVAVALPFRTGETKHLTSSHNEAYEWGVITLPTWAWLWSNDSDGSLGDSRGWWAANAVFGLDHQSFFAQWWWLCIRNPVNNLRYTKLMSCDVSKAEITYEGSFYVRDKPDQAGSQFVTAEVDGRKYHGLYVVYQWNENRAFVLRAGFKVEPRHADTDWDKESPHKRHKGFTFRISPYNEIRK